MDVYEENATLRMENIHLKMQLVGQSALRAKAARLQRENDMLRLRVGTVAPMSVDVRCAAPDRRNAEDRVAAIFEQRDKNRGDAS